MALPSYSLNNPGQPKYSLGSDAPVATGGKVQPRSPHGPKLKKPKKVTVKAHTRTVKPKSNGGAKAPTLDATQRALLDAAVKLRFGGQQQAINQQLQANARFTSGVPAWYQQAINEIKGIQGGQAASNQQMLQNIQAYNSPVAQTGTPEAVQAAQARNNLNSQFAAMFGRDAQANSDFMARMQAGMQTQQGNTINAANRDRQNLLGQQTQLAGEKGAYKTQYLAEQQAAADKADIENKKIQASLYIAQGKTDLALEVLKSLNKDRETKNEIAATNAKTARITARNNKMAKDRQYQLDVKKFGAAQAKDTYLQKHGLGPYKPGNSKGAQGNSRYSATKVQGFRDQWTNAKATAQQAKKNAKGGSTTDEIYTAMLGHFDADLAKAAALIAFNKPVSAGLRHRLALKGIHLPQTSPATSLANTVTGGAKTIAGQIKIKP